MQAYNRGIMNSLPQSRNKPDDSKVCRSSHQLTWQELTRHFWSCHCPLPFPIPSCLLLHFSLHLWLQGLTGGLPALPLWVGSGWSVCPSLFSLSYLCHCTLYLCFCLWADHLWPWWPGQGSGLLSWGWGLLPHRCHGLHWSR